MICRAIYIYHSFNFSYRFICILQIWKCCCRKSSLHTSLCCGKCKSTGLGYPAGYTDIWPPNSRIHGYMAAKQPDNMQQLEKWSFFYWLSRECEENILLKVTNNLKNSRITSHTGYLTIILNPALRLAGYLVLVLTAKICVHSAIFDWYFETIARTECVAFNPPDVIFPLLNAIFGSYFETIVRTECASFNPPDVIFPLLSAIFGSSDELELAQGPS